MQKNLLTSFLLLCLIPFWGFAQNYTTQGESGSLHPTLITTSEPVILVKSIADQLSSGEFIPAVDIQKEVNPKKWGANTSVPGKGLPKGNDPLFESQRATGIKSPGRAPLLTFEAASASITPTDPTGAVGPNHFVNAWNMAFRIWDKAGNPLTEPASLGTLFPGTLGDPIVIYDRFADRFLITEFFSNGFDVAICQGPDPVNDGWYVYRFPTNTFPDYPKFSVWSDGYYITANKDQNSASTSQVVFALERSEMITGNTTAQMVGFPLTGIVTSGFYSPLGFNCNGATLPPVGNAPIVYMQDDSWSGVSTDHLKIWNINVNWTTPDNSTISAPQIINTAAFDGLFDGGSFINLPQPSGSDIDALQATIMYMAQYRRFPGHNSVVFNFVVDIDGDDDYSGIRWYELRQTTDGAPWSIFQEGTYSQPDGHSAFCGNMCMDANGNIGLAYTAVSSTLFPALRYTGRLATDPPGIMTMAEQVIFNGTQRDPASRYGDYAQMTIDPNDDATFWSIGEVFAGSARKSYVGVFQFAPPSLTAAFSADAVTVCTGSSLTFTDESIPQPTSWNWSFPGGTPSSSNLENPPPVTYAVAGNYDVSLTVSNATETDTETKTAYITASDLLADFSASATTVVEGNSVIFTDLSSCGPTTWQWSFPGGTPADFTGQYPPSITYENVGSYDVTLTITKPGANTDITKTNYITVDPLAYCQPTYTYGTTSNDYISLVQLGDINNASGASSSPYYTYYSNLSTDLQPGSSYTITLSPGTYSSGNNISVWIDYNRNGTFETSEKLGNVDIPPTPATGTIIFSIPETAVIGTTRMRVREVWNDDDFSPCGNYSYGETEDYNVNILPSERNLTLTLLLEGLFNGVDMNKAQGISGDQYPGAVADHITLELHHASPPYALAGGPYIVEVLTDGTANVTIPASLGESYYIVIRHRNSIETWNAAPLSFNLMSLSYNFSSGASQAYGNNLKPASGKYLIFGGDVNQDGSIDTGDMTPVDNDAANFISGYLSNDANGDGTVDTGDMTIVDNNASMFVGKITP